MLITTGKKPDAASRIIAKSLAVAVPGSLLENRGQRTLASLISKARRLHFSRLCAIHMGKGAPHTISFLSLEGEKGWVRLSPKIAVRRATICPAAGTRRRQSECLSISGTRSKTLSALVSPRNSSEDAGSKIAASARKIALFSGNAKLFELGVSYEK